MRIIARKALRKFWEKHPEAAEPLKAWYSEVEGASWTNPAQVKQKYGSASVLKNNRVVFNIGGNKFRLVTAIGYVGGGVVLIKFVGTHEEYDAIDAEKVEYDPQSD
jgi:mRNA interferase HigB